MSSIIDKIKENLDILDVVSDHVKLKKSGRKFKGLCPFHAENTASFFVFPDTQRWHCFGACNEGGDIFDFVERINNWDFDTALRELARRAGVELEPLTEEKKAEIAEMRSYEAALGTLAAHFAENLANSEKATAYAHGRGWSDEVIEAERLGYADGGTLPELGNERAQQVARNLNRWAGDVGGAVIYVHRRRGRVVYLSGRSLDGRKGGDGHRNPRGEHKRAYVNAAYVLRAEELVIVEGQACAISLSDWGIPALALAGSGLSGGLGERLREHVEHGATIYLVPDGDGNTDVKSLAELVGPELAIVELPEGVEDVNDQHQKGATGDDFRAAMYEASTWLDLEIERVAGVNGRRATSERRRLFKALADLDTFALESYYRDRVKSALGIDQSTFNRLLKTAQSELVDELRNGDDKPRYVVHDGCLCALKFDGNGEAYTDPLCNFAAEVTEDVALDDGSGEPERTFRIRGILDDGTPLPTVQVPADKFSTMAWIQESWGIRAVTRAGFSRRDQLREAIQLQSQGAERRHVFTHTGWREVDGKRVYLHAGGAVGANDVEVELGAALSRYELPTEPENVREAVKASLRFLEVAPEEITVPLWAMTYLAPLTEILEPAFMGWLYGVTGTHKSTLAALALCHYGAFNYKNLPVDWVDTAYSLEMTAFRAKDVLMVVDDFAPQSDPYRARKMDGNAGYMVRAVGNRSGRGRLSANLTQRPVHPPRGMVLATGEQLPDGQSDNARLLTVELHDGDIDLARLSASQEEAGRYPHAMAGYAQWLAGQWDHLVEVLPAKQREQRKKMIDKMNESHRRVPDTLATLYLGLDLGLAYAVEVDVLTPAEAQDLRKRGWEALKRGASDQARRVERQRPTELFFNTLGNLLALGRVYLLLADDNDNDEGDKREERKRIGGGAAGSEIVGWYDNANLHLLPGAYNHVARFLRDENSRFPIRESALRKHLADEGFLERETENRYTARYWDGERQHRVLKLKLENVKKHIDLFDEDPPKKNEQSSTEKDERVPF